MGSECNTDLRVLLSTELVQLYVLYPSSFILAQTLPIFSDDDQMMYIHFC